MIFCFYSQLSLNHVGVSLPRHVFVYEMTIDHIILISLEERHLFETINLCLISLILFCGV